MFSPPKGSNRVRQRNSNEKEVKMTREEKIEFLIDQYSFMSDEMIDQEYKCQLENIEDSKDSPMDKLFPGTSNKLKKLTLFDFSE